MGGSFEVDRMSLSPLLFFFFSLSFLLVFSRELDNEKGKKDQFYQGCEGERENKGGGGGQRRRSQLKGK